MKYVSWEKVRIIVFSCLIFTTVSCNSDQLEDSPPDVGEKEMHHPFLIVKKESFEALRANADEEPWKSMKADAISRSANGSPTKPYDLQYYVGAAALAYILDEDNSSTHAHRVRDAILNQYSKLEFSDGSSWGGVVPPMGSAFVAILALDIIYDALTIEEIVACENVLSSQIFKIDRDGSWIDVRLGTHGAWDIYKGDRTTPDDDYYESIMWQVTEDGVSPVTNHYAWERVGGGNSRVSKSGYMDVLEFTGIDQRYYSNERLQKFQRWLFGSSVNCAKEMAIFGDMLPTQGISNDMLHRRVVNFDAEAAGYAAWFHEDRPAIGNIITYIIPQQELPAPAVPSSQIFSNGGAFFREKADDPNGLHAVLYNIKSQDEWHTHQEVNGLALSGYGNRLMVNGGRLGAPTRSANLNNTLTINGKDHTARIGGGIVEGFTAELLDYSCGFSGPALSGASHYRNLMLVHGTDGINPYFVVIDEVTASPGNQVKNYLHPANQSSVSMIAQNTEYEASIDHHPTVPGGKLSFFYGTSPTKVNIEKVPSAVPDRYPDYPDHNRLESVYDANAEGKINLVTVLFPHNGANSKAAMSRVTGSGYSGCAIQHSAMIKDLALESGGIQEYAVDDVTFQGKAILSRTDNGINSLYFVRHGMKFDQQGTGFTSDAAVSIYANGKEGVIVSDGTAITLSGNGIESVTFDPQVSVIESGQNMIKVQLAAGEVRFSSN